MTEGTGSGSDRDRQASGPLAGTRVLAFEHMLQGPLASLLLSELGADVIKIEPLTGSVERTLTGRGQWINGRTVLDLVVNRGKRSLTIDLKNPRSRKILDELLGTADIVIHNFRPGVMRRLGLGFEDIHPRFPRIVYAAASGYGEDGPYRDRPGQDLLVQAMTGMMYLSGRREDPPVPVGSTVIDVHSGTLLALGVCAALVAARRTGKGSEVAVDLLASAMHLQFEPINYALNAQTPMIRGEGGLADPYHHAPYGVYATTDGYLAISTNDMGRLVECLSTVEPVDVPLDMSSAETFAMRNEIRARIAAVVARRSSEAWLALFRPAGVWAELVRPAGADIRNDPQVRHRGLVVNMPGSSPVDTFRIPIEIDGAGRNADAPYPGQNSLAILEELGFSPNEIEAFRADAVVGAHTDRD